MYRDAIARFGPDGRDPDAVVDDADRLGDGHRAIIGGVEHVDLATGGSLGERKGESPARRDECARIAVGSLSRNPSPVWWSRLRWRGGKAAGENSPGDGWQRCNLVHGMPRVRRRSSSLRGDRGQNVQIVVRVSIDVVVAVAEYLAAAESSTIPRDLRMRDPENVRARGKSGSIIAGNDVAQHDGGRGAARRDFDAEAVVVGSHAIDNGDIERWRGRHRAVHADSDAIIVRYDFAEEHLLVVWQRLSNHEPGGTPLAIFQVFEKSAIESISAPPRDRRFIKLKSRLEF